MRNFPFIMIGIAFGLIVAAAILGQGKNALIASCFLVVWLIYFTLIKRKEKENHGN